MHIGTVRINGHVISAGRLQMISKISWSLMMRPINPNPIRLRMSGCRLEKSTGVSTVGAGLTSRKSIGCGTAPRSGKRWVCWLRLAGNRTISADIPFLIEWPNASESFHQQYPEI